MAPHKATPDCWEWQEKWASQEAPDEISSCILELRARVEALEAQASNYPETPDSSPPPPVATDEELLKLWNSERACRPWVSRRAIYNLGVAHGQTGSREVAEPAPVAEGLVERVAMAIHPDRCADPNLYLHEARAAILEVAKWLRKQGTPASGWAMRLEQEAGR
jgi:hypothetical protein